MPNGGNSELGNLLLLKLYYVRATGNRETVVPFPARVSNFSLLQIVQTGAQVLPASYQMLSGPISPGKKQSGHEGDQSPSCTVEVKNEWNCTPLPPVLFAVCTVTTLPYDRNSHFCFYFGLQDIQIS